MFVQFIHPGGEHHPDEKDVRSWNRGNHKRKFLQGQVSLLSGADRRVEVAVFWGEWEAESKVVRTIEGGLPDGPRFVQEPFWIPKGSYLGLQNTDPFVFGECISYTGCQQHTVRGETFLRRLDRGSVVLFGSCKAAQFVLDTVLVVDSWVEHDALSFDLDVAPRLNPTHRTVTFAPWYAGARQSSATESPANPPPCRSCRLYFGATVDRPMNGMFSYFPCLPAEGAPCGFERPTIVMDQITQGLLQGKRGSAVADLDQMSSLWQTVRGQVEAQGLFLGLNADMPPMRGSERRTRRGRIS